MKRFSIVILSFVACTACATKRQGSIRIEDWITCYKNSVFISAVKRGHPGIEEKDISQSVNFDIMGFDTLLSRETDSIGKALFESIKPSHIPDFNGKKSILNRCLAYYRSEELDKLARKSYKQHVAE